MNGINFTDYTETELDKLKSNVVNLDNNVEQYDKQIKRCEDTIKDLEDSLNDLATELSNAATQVERDRIKREIIEKRDLKSKEETKKKRVEKGRKKVKKSYDEAADELERVTGKEIDKDELKKEVRAKQEEKEAKEKAKLWSQKANIVIQIISGINSIVKEWYQASIDIQLNQMETMTRITSEGIRTIGSGINRVLSSSLKSITTGVQEGAYASAESGIDTSMQIQNYEMSKREQELSMENFAKTRRAEATASTVKTMSSVIGGVVGGAIGAAFSGGLATAIGASVGASVGNVIGSLADWYPTVIKNAAQLNEAQLKQLNETQRSALEVGTSMQKEFIQFSNDIETKLGKNQTASKNIQATTGINTSVMSSNENILFNMQKMIGVRGKNGEWQHLDVGLEEMDKMQTSYSDITGKGIVLGLNDYLKQAQLGHVVGSQDLAVQLTSGMEIFNKSAAEGSDILFEMYKTANNMGISSRKYAKELVKNMKLAEKYSFKNGVQGLMKMAAWAQKTRFNMDSFESTLQKVSEGGLEGIIKMGAEFQVLGGNAAMAADPIAMLYERYSDPEALAKRMHSMVKGYGSFNKETGEVDVSGTDLMMVEQIAKVRGVPVNDVLNEIKQERKGEQINKVLGEGQYNDKQRALLTQKATYNVEKQKWEVVGADQKVHDINNLTDKDFEAMAMDHDQTMEEYVFDIMGNVAKMAGTKREGEQKTMDSVREEWNEQVKTRIKEDRRFYEDSNGTLKNLITQNMKFATEMDKINHETFEKSADLFKTTNDIMLKNAKTYPETITNANGMIMTALKVLNGEANIEDDKVREKLGLKTEKEKEVYNKKIGYEKEYNEIYEKTKNATTVKENLNALSKMTDARAGYINEQANESWAKGDIFGYLKNSSAAIGSRITGLLGTIPIATGVRADKYMDFLLPNDNKTETNNNETIVGGDKVVPVKDIKDLHDGTVEYGKPDNNDTALFAKNGGPFDKLFNGVFGRIDDIYNNIFNSSSNTNIGNVSNMMSSNISKIFGDSTNIDLVPAVSTIDKYSKTKNNTSYTADPIDILYKSYSDPEALIKRTKSIGMLSSSDVSIKSLSAPQQMIIQSLSKQMGVSPNDIKSGILPRMGKQTEIMEYKKETNTNGGVNNVPSNTNYSQQPIDVKLSGEITLKTENGQTFDITKQLENDPMLIRAISRMISKQITVASNGGRGKSIFNIGSV